MKKILTLLVLAGSLIPSFAIFPFYEPFADATGSGGTSYAEGSLLGGQINAAGDSWYATGSAEAGVPVVVTNLNLSYSGLPASSGNALWLRNASGPGARMFVSTTIDGFLSMDVSNTVFYSMILQVLDITDLSPTSDHAIGFNNQATIQDQTGQPSVQGGRLMFRKLDDTQFQIGIAKQSLNAEWDPTPRSVGEILFVVVGVEIIPPAGSVNDNLRLWVNPASETFATQTPPAETASLLGVENDQATRLSSFQILNRTATNPNSLIVDEVRVGFTWAFVTGGPEINLHLPADTVVGQGNDLVLTVDARSGGSSALTYKWQKDGGDLNDGGKISGSTTASLTVSGAISSDEGMYSVIVSNDMGSASSETIVAVSSTLIVTHPENSTNDVGTTAVFSVETSGPAPSSYLWHHNGNPLSDGGNISGATTATLTVSSVGNTNAGNYHVVATAGGGVLLTSDTATLTILASSGIPLYWDTNGETPGSDAVDGLWTDPKWSMDASGSVTTGVWLDNAVAVFSAGDEATGLFTVTVTGTQTLTGLTVEEGSVTTTATGTLLFAHPSDTAEVHVTGGAEAFIGTVNNSTRVAGTNDIVKTGGGLLRFRSQNNPRVGKVIIKEGTFQIQQDNMMGAVPEIFVPDYVTLDGGTMDWANTGGQQVDANRGFTITTNGGTLSKSAAANVTINGAVTGPGPLTRSGLNTLIFAADNDFSGPFTNLAGNTQLNGNNNISNGISLESGILTINGPNLANGIQLNGGELRLNTNGAAGIGVITIKPGAILRTQSTGADDQIETLTITNDIVTTGEWATLVPGAGSQDHLELSGIVSGPGGILRMNTGNQRAIVSGDNTYSGGTKIVNGTLVAGHKNAFGTGTITIGEPDIDLFPVGCTDCHFIQFNGLFNMTGENAITNPIIAYQQFSMAISIQTNELEFSGPVELAAPDFNVRVFANYPTLVHRISGVISSASGQGLGKHGVGTLVLSAANTYPGGTVVVSGSLRVNNTTGSGTGSGSVTVESAATLGGSGTIAGNVSSVGGNISPGAATNQTGKLTLQNGLNLTGGGTVIWELGAPNDDGSGSAGTDFDQIALTGGNLALGTAASLSLNFIGMASAPDSSDPFWQQARQWTVVSVSGSGTSSGENFAALLNADNSAGVFSTMVEPNGSIVLHFTPNTAGPEFSSITAGATGVTFSWHGENGVNYEVQYKDDLNDAGWLTLSSHVGAGIPISVSDEYGTHSQRFYRLVIVP